LKKQSSILGIKVVIPARNEPNGHLAAEALVDPKFNDIDIEIIVVINAAISDESTVFDNNRILSARLDHLSNSIPENYKIHMIRSEHIPEKKSGVGYARKLGMDEAARRFHENNQTGIIVCYDADCKAPSGYLSAIYRVFRKTGIELGIIRFRHELVENSEAILTYEAMLRFYSLSLRKAGYPFWHQTVGSCMAVRSDTYLKQGGMNSRQAGEDFYFLHKLMPVCATTTIVETENMLSSRMSDRVPFGTGRAMLECSNQKIRMMYTYHPSIFYELEKFILGLKSRPTETLQNGNTWVHAYFNEFQCWSDLENIAKHTKGEGQFIKSFFQYFNGFRVLKYVHWCRDQYVANVPVLESINHLISAGTDSSWPNVVLKLREMEIDEIKIDREIIADNP
jgi:hypothetical protein